MAGRAIAERDHAQPAVHVQELLALVLFLHNRLNLLGALVSEQQGDRLYHCAVAIHELSGWRDHLAIRAEDVLHAKAGVPDGPILGQSVHHQPGIGSGRSRFGHEQWVVLARIGRAEFSVAGRILGIDVGGDEIQMRR